MGWNNFITALVNSVLSTVILILRSVIDNTQNTQLDITDIFKDYLFLFFLFFGIVISLLHEFIDKRQKYKISFLMILLSFIISFTFTVLVGVLYSVEVLSIKVYYVVVLFTASFSPGLVKYFLVHLPEKFGGGLIEIVNNKIKKI